MPYAPGISYRGDQSILAAGNNIAQSLAEFTRERELERRKQDFLTGQAVSRAAAGQLTGEQLQEFLSQKSPDKQAGMLAGFDAAQEDQLRQKRAELLNQQLKGAIQEIDQRGQLFPTQLQTAKTEADTAEAAAKVAGAPVFAQDGKTQVGVFDAKGSPHYFRGMADAEKPFTPSVVTLNDPITGKPFSVFSRGPNQFDLTPGSAGAPAAGTPAYDDQGNQVGIWSARGTITKLTQPKAPDPVKAAIAQAITGNAPAPTPAGAPAPTTATPAPAGGLNTAPVKVTSQQQFDALPSGALFIAPDNSVRRKP